MLNKCEEKMKYSFREGRRGKKGIKKGSRYLEPFLVTPSGFKPETS